MQKRPLLHPPISSPYNGRQSAKVVYISSKTPFMSAMKRVKQLLKYVDKRSMQSVLSSRGKNSSTPATTSDEKAEEVLIKATGKAIDKALNLALYFQGQQDCAVRINTGSVNAIDDLIQTAELSGVDQEVEAEEEGQTSERTGETIAADLPEARIRHASMIEIFVSLRP